MKANAVGPRNLQLHYQAPHELDHFKPGLRTRIQYRSEFDDQNDWTEFDTRDFDSHQGNVNVTFGGLFPYALYTIRIRLQSNMVSEKKVLSMKCLFLTNVSSQANETEERLWSEAAETTARTLASPPGMAPKVAPGSFEIVGGALQTRRVYLYWQHIPVEQQNGPDFKYQVTEVFKAGKA